MRQHGRARIDPQRPEALAECDRCGFLFNWNKLGWQFDWRGTNLQSLGLLVCETCMDSVQENGQRAILLPPDPIPTRDARPRNFLNADNPMSPIGLTLTSNIPAGGFFGTMTGGAGVASAFDGNSNKTWLHSAYIVTSDSSFGNYVAKNWSPYVGGITSPSSISAPVITHSLSSFSATAPNDRSFLSSAATVWAVRGSNNGVSWTTLLTGVTAGTAGETVGGEPPGSNYRFHNFSLLGDGASQLSVAQVKFSVSQVSSS